MESKIVVIEPMINPFNKKNGNYKTLYVTSKRKKDHIKIVKYFIENKTMGYKLFVIGKIRGITYISCGRIDVTRNGFMDEIERDVDIFSKIGKNDSLVMDSFIRKDDGFDIAYRYYKKGFLQRQLK